MLARAITPDTPDELKQAIDQYGITSPMISDDRSTSEAFSTLGKGMHADTPGHAFVLIDGRGTGSLATRLLPATPKPAQLLEDISDQLGEVGTAACTAVPRSASDARPRRTSP